MWELKDMEQGGNFRFGEFLSVVININKLKTLYY